MLRSPGMAIQLCAYDPTWPERFAREAERLRAALGSRARRIEHVGSTAVPGLAAKPVIDIYVEIPTFGELDRCREALGPLGYHFETRPLAYFHRPAAWPHTHHVHLRDAADPAADRMLRFRDWLRTHAADREAYEALKRDLARRADAESLEGRMRYSEAKTEFIRGIEKRYGEG